MAIRKHYPKCERGLNGSYVLESAIIFCILLHAQQ